MKLTTTYEQKIIRTIYKVTLYNKGSINSLKHAIDHIPDDATLIDEDEDDNDNTVLIFEVEKKEDE